MFVPIQQEDMVLGKKYLIDTEVDTMTGILKSNGQMFLRFMIYKSKQYKGDYLFLKETLFFQFISKNPQWQMERRSVNLFVRRLIGDDNFEW